ncbi:hypothetical protein K438DRAFT_2032920 [Mycena galopus ATCC 62051]|nr:hypothetical protein K438DRAFT_2032920 [Mycena galopus ATCC 62051]
MANFSTRLRLRKGPVSLAQLRLWQAISSIKVARDLPFLHAGILFGYLFLHLLPASLWAAALAPILSQTTTLKTIRVPFYPPDPTNDFWNQTAWNGRTVRTESGVFSYNPAEVLQGPIFNDASTATASAGVRLHAKIDNSFLSYVGRSYGVGASAGLEDYVFDGSQPTSLLFTYQEPGYFTTVNCWRNDSSAWGLHLEANGSAPAYPNTYPACGILPNSLYTAGTFSDSGCPDLIPGFQANWYALSAIQHESNILALRGLSGDSRHMFPIAAGSRAYTTFDKVQWEAHFVPQNFEVSVNTTGARITVTPLGNSTVDMDPSAATRGIGFGILAQFVIGQVTYLAQSVTGLYGSAMGDAFLSNIQNAAMETRNVSVNDTSVVLEGVSSALESMIDDLLVAVASAQLEIAGQNSTVARATTPPTTTVTVAAMHLGTVEYIATLNFLIVAVYFVEFVRTWVWRGLPLFDYTDTGSLIVAVSRGGEQLGAAVAVAHKDKGSLWTGDSGMEGTDTRISLRFRDGMPTIEAMDLWEEDDEGKFLKEDHSLIPAFRYADM